MSVNQILKNDKNPDPASASSGPIPNSRNFKFERPDWALFRSIGTLSQKAGVPKDMLRRLVLKELTDNALDLGGKVEVGRTVGGYVIRDYGAGIDGSPDQIARLFSIGRPLVSSKVWRLPTRGALGNGLRVVAGAVIASSGWLRVTTRNQRLVLTPKDDGTTSAVAELVDYPVGTLVEIGFGPEMPADSDGLAWSRAAINLARGTEYSGRTSPHWYDPAAFFELLQAAGELPVRQFVENLDGCTGARAGQIAAPWKGIVCNALERQQAGKLLIAAQAHAKQVRPERLGAIGQLPGYTGYAIGRDYYGTTTNIPFVVEAWAGPVEGDRRHAELSINRTPIGGILSAYFAKGKVTLSGFGLFHSYRVGSGRNMALAINVTTPYCPITTDGKSPDLKPFVSDIFAAVQRAINRARRALPATSATEKKSQKLVVIENLDDAIDKASGNRQFRFNPRQVFYNLRPVIQAELGAELTYGNFNTILTEYESEHGDIAGMYRDPRGTFYHPHNRTNIPLGTMAVEKYSRPEWIFNKVIYIEKEGFFEALKAVSWAERHDAALLTSKGFSTRAVRDLLDLLGDHAEPVKVFCIHDADASGTMIYQTLQEATKARPRRRIEIVNLGLEPWEAEEMGLHVESIKDREGSVAVADYVNQRVDGEHWADWLQTHRVELNEMSTPQFISWLDEKMRQHGGGKVIPPGEYLSANLDQELDALLRAEIENKILREASIDCHVAAARGELRNLSPTDIEPKLRAWLDANPEGYWKDWIDFVANDMIDSATDGGGAA